MSNAEDIRLLAQDMAASYDARIGELASIRENVSDLMSGFKEGDKERCSEISDLKKGVSDLMDGFKEGDKERCSEVSDLKKGVSDLRDNFRKECEETANAWHGLAATMESKRGRKTGKTVKVRQAHGKGKKD